MKRALLFLFIFIMGSNLIAQNEWNYIWALKELPFSPYVNDTTKVGSEMSIVKAGFDTDEDGWGEFFCAYSDQHPNNYILMYEATADNTYELVWSFNFPLPANTFPQVAVGDIDNSGVVDIIVTMPSVVGTEPNPPRLWFFEWNGVQGENEYGRVINDELIPNSQWNFGVDDGYDFRPYSQIIEDIDNDGKNELISGVRVAGSNNREVVVSSVNGQLTGFGSWQVEYRFSESHGGSLYSATTGDLDGDGNKEIYAMIWNNFTFRLFENTGDGQFETAVALDQIYQDRGIDYGALDGVVVADVNNDGVNELYIAGTESTNQLFIITDISDVSQITETDIQELLTIPVVDQGKFRSMQLADPDNDGNLSLMIAGERNGQIYDLEYQGSGDPADSANWQHQVIFDIWELSGSTEVSPRLFYGHPGGDMDQDGKDEYLFVNYSSDFSVWEDDAYLFMIEIDQVTGVASNESLIPNDISLEQNYPNPFNPSTVITFGLPEAASVNLTIYDLLGREIKVLVDDQLPAGTHIANFDASNLAAGTYFYTLKAGNKSETRKMLLLK
jgi:hypothetical protein